MTLGWTLGHAHIWRNDIGTCGKEDRRIGMELEHDRLLVQHKAGNWHWIRTIDM